MAREYFSFQGEVWLGKRDTSGNVIELNFMGNVPEFEINLSVDKTEHIEDFTGERTTDSVLIKAKKADISLSSEELLLENLSLGLYGVSSDIAAGTVTDWAFPITAAAGATGLLPHQMISSLVLKDSTPTTPQTLEAGVDYEADLTYGSVKFLDVTDLTQPIKASYSHGKVAKMAIFGTNAPERWIRFKGVNTLNDKKVLVDLYRVSFDPGSLSLIAREYGKFPLKGQLLGDTTKKNDPALGMFGKYVELG